MQILFIFNGVRLAAQGTTSSDPLLPVWAEIRTEGIRASSDPVGRPLPLAATWQTGSYGGVPQFDPGYQMGLVDQGNYLLTSFQFPDIGSAYSAYYQTGFPGAQARNLPICFVGTQWEDAMTYDPYLSRTWAGGTNPNVFDRDNGTVDKWLWNNTWRGFLDPLGPASAWQEIGSDWVSSPIWATFQSLYPQPPRLILLSNNEAKKLYWADSFSPCASTSRRFKDAYGLNQTGEFKRQCFGDHWTNLYRTMQAAMRTGLNASGTWGGPGTLFVGYDAFGPSFFRRWGGWHTYSLPISGRIDPNPLMWDGGSPSYYLMGVGGDYQVWSPQVECQNWVFMHNEALRLNPDFWFEMSVWDGNDGSAGYGVQKFLNAGQTYTPDRYRGWIQYGMWITRPRVVREYRGWTERRDCNGPANGQSPPYSNTGYTNEQFFLALCSAVNHVHTSPTLRSFWRQGTLVKNTAETHPYQDTAYVPAGYGDNDTIIQSSGRWFMLTASANPARTTWTLNTQLTVYALALVKGTAPNRQWLMYLYAPLGNQAGVTIILPGYGAVTKNVSSSGAYWKVDEASRTESLINDFTSLPICNIRGTAALSGYAGDDSAVPVTIQLRGSTIRTDNVTLDVNGNFTLANVAPGTYEAWVKAAHWLGCLKSGIVVGSYDVTDLGALTLVNGDANDDNAITVADLSMALTGLDVKSGNPNWEAGADLDGDGEVTSMDLSILLAGMDRIGDPSKR